METTRRRYSVTWWMTRSLSDAWWYSPRTKHWSAAIGRRWIKPKFSVNGVADSFRRASSTTIKHISADLKLKELKSRWKHRGRQTTRTAAQPWKKWPPHAVCSLPCFPIIWHFNLLSPPFTTCWFVLYLPLSRKDEAVKMMKIGGTTTNIALNPLNAIRSAATSALRRSPSCSLQLLP